MIIIGVIISLLAAAVFAAIGFGIVTGIQYTIRTRMMPRFKIMGNRPATRVFSVIYVIVLASLPATLAIYTAWQIIAMVRAIG
ncbi:MAG: hypothetical protein RI985_305 [Chloroflexota bacterium]|jgi:hypothetical protein